MVAAIELPSPCLVVLVGVAGAGKSTWAAANFERHHIVSSDALRALVGEGEGDQKASKDAFALLDDIVRRRLSRRLTTVVDTLGLNAERRASYRSMAVAADIPCVAILIETDPARTRRQNRQRDKRVPERVVSEQLEQWSSAKTAIGGEGFAAVHVITSDERPGPGRPQRTATLVPAALLRRSPAEPRGAARPALRFGLHVSRFATLGKPDVQGERLRQIARAAEVAGFADLWVMDHFRQIPQLGRAWEEMLESYTTLSHLAAVTSTIRLGTLVTGVTYRNAAHLAKIVATLDVLSGGRANCGLGLGWFKQEHDAYGWPFPPVGERYALLEDVLQLLPMMWAAGTKPFTGRVLNVPETMCYPRPLQTHIPILVGGSGERRTLKLVARFADACNLFGEADVILAKLAVLQRHCDDVGREITSIDVTQLSTVLVGDDPHDLTTRVERLKPPQMSAERFAVGVNAGTTAQHIDRFCALAATGVNTAIVSLADLEGPEQLERFAGVIAAFR